MNRALVLALPLLLGALVLAMGRDFQGLLYLLLVPMLLAGALAVYAATLGSRAVLTGLLAVIAIVPNITFETHKIGDVGLDIQNGSKFLIWVILLVIVAVNLRRIRTLLLDPAIALFLLYAAVAALSAIWSVAPAYSLASAIGMAAYATFPCVLAKELDERTVVTTLALALAAYLAGNLGVTVADPAIAFFKDETGMRLQGVAGHPNSLGAQSAIMICLLLVCRARRYLRAAAIYPLLALAMACLVLSDSRSSMLAALLAWCVVQVRSNRPRARTIGFVGGAAGVALFLAATEGLIPSTSQILADLSRSGQASEIATLSGRTELWRLTWRMMLNHPFLGYGFNTAEIVLTPVWFTPIPSASANAHNMLLQSLLTLGMLGTLPLAALVAVLAYRLIAAPSLLRDYIAVFVFVSGMAEADMSTTPVLLTFVFGCGLAIAARRAERRATFRAPPPRPIAEPAHRGHASALPAGLR